MRVFVVTPPAPVVTFDQARVRLRLDADLPDDEIQDVAAMIATATSDLDGPGGWLGRALGVQTLEAQIDGFPLHARVGIELPCPPVIAIESLTYLDATNTPQQIASDGLSLISNVVEPTFGTSWPTTQRGPQSVRIRYQAGYVADPSADPLVPALPENIRSAILLKVQALYDGDPDGRLAAAAADLLEPLRVW